MNDDELEAALRRYRGIDPPASLRARVLVPGGPVRVPLTRLDWALAAATLLLTAGAAMTDPGLSDAAASEVQSAWETSVEELAATMGGGDGALAYAQMVVPRPELMPQGEEE
jgi:hypothetical protein